MNLYLHMYVYVHVHVRTSHNSNLQGKSVDAHPRIELLDDVKFTCVLFYISLDSLWCYCNVCTMY